LVPDREKTLLPGNGRGLDGSGPSWSIPVGRERTARALAIGERGARRLIDANVVGVVFDADEHLTEANDEFLRMIGYSRADLEARRLSWREITPPEYRDLDDRCLAELERRGECAPVEKEYWRKDGTRVPVLVGAALVTRSPMECVSFVLDVTDRRRADEERRRLLLAAVEANRVKDDFLATLAHELRSPLSSIVLWIGLLRGGHLDVEAGTRAIDAIERNTRLMTRLVEDLLDVGRIASGKLSVELARVDLRSIVAAVLEGVRPAMEAKHLRLEAHMERRTMTVHGDPARLHQILSNLLTNAIKFTPDGGRIAVELAQTGSAARILVSDTGRGIAADSLPRVFERFHQVDASSDQPQDGLGLGLGIVRYLVERHGGTIAAASPGLGQGATFSVTLPLSPDEVRVTDRSSVSAA
jgi:hypothetical protein